VGAPGPRFDQWFLAVKAPALVAERGPSYLARLPPAEREGLSLDTGRLEERLAGLALEDLDRDPAQRTRLVAEWGQAQVKQAWRQLQDSTVADRVASAVRGLIAIPAQVGTALLLTILISFDMLGLKRGAQRLREGRLAWLYAKAVPNLAAVARLIGRSFAAQGVIAVFNTLLTLALMRLLGLQNELLLSLVVFIASFIPVLGILLSAIPITLQALLQPDGSLAMALYALLGIGVIHAIESMILSPKIVGKFLHLHPVLVLVVLVVGEHLFGIWGLLLGVPVAVFTIHAGILAESIPGVYEPGRAAGPCLRSDPADAAGDGVASS
jgi:predicted PurR-regulated permease PerM